MSVLNEISQQLIDGDAAAVVKLVQKALDEAVEAQVILNDGLLAGMEVVGKRFKEGDMFLPEVICSADTMKKAVLVLKPKLAEQNSKKLGNFLIGTVEGDVHDIGKNLVTTMLEGAGFNVQDIGVDNSPEKFVKAIEAFKPDIVGMCALLSTTMPALQRSIEAITEAGYRNSVKIMVGGAPVNAEFAEKIGADAYAPNAVVAVDLSKAFL